MYAQTYKQYIRHKSALVERDRREIWGFLAPIHILRDEATKLYWLLQPSVSILAELSQGGKWSKGGNGYLLGLVP